MKFLFSNLEKEFRRQIGQWFEFHPEMPFKWIGTTLEIYHPRGDINRTTIFDLGKNEISVSYNNQTRTFKRRRLKSISNQVYDILAFWKGNMMSEEDLDIFEPPLEESQYALMQCERRTGIVLTTKGNQFTGWGDVFWFFDYLKAARDFASRKQSEDIECNIYDSNYEHVETIY